MNCAKLATLVFFAIVLTSAAVLTGCATAPIPTFPAPAPVVQVAPTLAPTETGPTASSTPTLAPTETPTAIPTETALPSSTPTLAPTFTPTLVPSPTIRTTPTIKPTSTRAPIPTAGMLRIKIFFIALNDNGMSGRRIGCNDSSVGVDRLIPATSAPLTAALKELFAVRDQYYGQSGLYNALYQSTLKTGSITIVNNKATINLTGTLTMGGVCDSPRIAAQIQETALQFSTVKQVVISINGVPLEQLLSGKGG